MRSARMLVVYAIIILSLGIGRGAATHHRDFLQSKVATEASALQDGQVEFVNRLAGNVEAVTADGTYAYAAIDSRLVVLSTLDPASPTVVGQTGALSWTIWDVAVQGDLVFAATGSGVKIIDVGLPSSPIEIGACSDTSAFGVAISSNYAYIGGGSEGFQVCDFSVPSNPKLVGSYPTYQYAYGVAISGNYAYVSAWEFFVLDVSDPTEPSYVGHYTPVDPEGYSMAVAVRADRAYVGECRYSVPGATGGGVRIIDVSDPRNPTALAFHNTPGGWAEDLALAEGRVYAADGEGGLRIVDVSGESPPTEVGFYDTPGRAEKLALVNSYIYVADGAGGLLILRFPAAGPTYSVSGHVRDAAGNPVSGVTLSLGASGSTIVDAAGAYTVAGLVSGTYTLTPSKPGWTFEPPTRTVSVPPDATGQDFTGHFAAFPNDPLFPQQWGLSQIGITGAWSCTHGTNDVVIAVIDTGVDYTHVELGAPKTITDSDVDYVGPDNDDAMDEKGHGTHVAGIAGANTNNAHGIAGVCPECRILPLRVLPTAGKGTWADVADAIRYAADHEGVRVINLSLGDIDCTPSLADAINDAYDKGVTLVGGSGNSCPVKVALGQESRAVYYPARFGRVIAVGATNASDRRAWFSNYGPPLDVVAPGVGILSAYPSNGYKRLDGTSMATPLVAGLAGLILSKEPSLTPAQVQATLERSAVDLGPDGWDEETGWGRVDATKALQTTVGTVAPVPPVMCGPPVADQAGQSESEGADLLTLYSSVRDEVLMPSNVGPYYVELFYEYGPELAGILLTDPDLRDRTALFLDHASTAFGSLLPGATEPVLLDQALYNEGDLLVQDLAAVGSDGFRSELLDVWSSMGLEQHVGSPAAEIWIEMQSIAVYLPLIVK